jgi:hypothetical protein
MPSKMFKQKDGGVLIQKNKKIVKNRTFALGMLEELIQ